MSILRAKPLKVDLDFIPGLVRGASVGVLGAPPSVSNTGGKSISSGSVAAVAVLLDKPVEPVEPVDVELVAAGSEGAEQARIDTLTFSFSGLRFSFDVHPVRQWLNRWSGGRLTVGGNLQARYNGYRQCLQIVLASGAESPILGWLGISDLSDPMRGRWCLHFTGAACEVLRSGDWARLYADLADYEGKITRIDLAYDELDGEHSVAWIKDQYEAGSFDLAGRPPKFQFIQSSDGDTFYVGRRGSGKLCRSYQKGRQLGNEDSSWVRHEVELRNCSRVIPLDVLVNPTRYFKGAYPSVFCWLAGGSSLIKTFHAKHKIVFEQAMIFARRQVGRLIRYCSDVIGYSPEQIISDLQAETGRYPMRLFVIDDDLIDLSWA